jgi:hypothetical protein
MKQLSSRLMPRRDFESTAKDHIPMRQWVAKTAKKVDNSADFERFGPYAPLMLYVEC